MQIEDLLNTGIRSGQNPLNIDDVKQKDASGRVVTSADADASGSELRSISLNDPFYDKNTIKNRTVADRIDEADRFGGDTRALKNRMVIASETMSKDDYRRMSEEGFDPMATGGDEIVTVADQIKLQLAKAGVDVDKMGGLDDEAIETMTGSAGYAKAIERALDAADLPTDDAIIDDGITALKKAAELPADGQLNDDAVMYLVSNELEPTIENVYRAVFSSNAAYKAEGGYRADGSGLSVDIENVSRGISDEDWDELMPRAAEIVRLSGRDDLDGALSDARRLIDNGQALTPENLDYMASLEHGVKVSPKDIIDAVTVSVDEGHRPQEAYVVYGYSLHDKAEVVADIINDATNEAADAVAASQDTLSAATLKAHMDSDAVGKADFPDITARRVLEETRLLMTQEANLALLKRGVSIDTTELSELVEMLKNTEEELAAEFPGAPTDPDRLELYNAANSAVEEIRTLPAALLGTIPSLEDATLPVLQREGRTLAAKFAAANERYETMQTEVRRDLGDSISKAFRNVDDILEDIGLETTAANERAVRILAYNELSITPESVLAMKETDVKVSALIREMTPGVVKELIDRGENPLDLRLDQMIEKVGDIRSEMDGTKDDEGFASFLWKAEQNGEIGEEERDSFIGIYRLLHQVEKTDGAVIGQLLHQGAEITLRNLMGAVRTRKHENREYTIDDDFGERSGIENSGFSITEQIEAAFQTARAHDAIQAMTPAKMHAVGEENCMSMDPDRFAAAMESAPADEVEEDIYYSEKLDRLKEAVSSETEIYDVLRRYDLPADAGHLSAIAEYMKDTGYAFKNIFGSASSDRRTFKMADAEGREATLSDIMEDIIEDFGEAAKTPEDMAEAQRKLYDIAENVMRHMIDAEDVRSIDVRRMQNSVMQMSAFSDMAKRDETYAIPIMVADSVGNLTLKIVRGKEEDKGIVDLALDTDTTGAMRAAFKVNEGRIEGTVTAERENTRALLSDRMMQLTSALNEAVDMPIELAFVKDSSLSASDVLRDSSYGFEATRERDEVSTERLYGIARAFIDVLTLMF